ncbi:hypothetical protein C8R47DRAFT_1315720 [Mycena vitilis]|nr:hypothetical protein C8R47DRAFT_1315720 [Mycena vitilis]
MAEAYTRSGAPVASSGPLLFTWTVDFDIYREAHKRATYLQAIPQLAGSGCSSPHGDTKSAGTFWSLPGHFGLVLNPLHLAVSVCYDARDRDEQGGTGERADDVACDAGEWEGPESCTISAHRMARPNHLGDSKTKDDRLKPRAMTTPPSPPSSASCFRLRHVGPSCPSLLPRGLLVGDVSPRSKYYWARASPPLAASSSRTVLRPPF